VARSHRFYLISELCAKLRKSEITLIKDLYEMVRQRNNIIKRIHIIWFLQLIELTV